jgi:HlyD family secretion protein
MYKGVRLLKKLAFIVILIGLAVGAYFAFGRPTVEDPGDRYITVPVEKGTLVAEVMCTGTLNPLNAVLVGSQVSGRIKELNADFESKVKKDQLIALIDPATFEAKVAEARADLEAAEAQRVKDDVTLVDELRNLKRKKILFQRGSISESEFDTATTKADAAKAQVNIDKARAAQMRAKLQEAELQLRYTRILAPVDGVVTSRSVDVGQTVAASFQAPVLFKIAEDLTRMQVHANVDEADIGQVQVGQKAVFTVPAFPDLEFDASVTQIRNEPKTELNVVTYIVIMDVDNSDLKLRPGMTANVRILLARADDAMMVPEQALRFSPASKSKAGLKLANLPDLGSGKQRIWRLRDKNEIEPVVVKTGVVGTEKVQILSSELKPGQKVVVDEIKTKTKRSMRRRGLRFRF